MWIHPRSRHRPFHWGPFPLEVLPRDERLIALESATPFCAATGPEPVAGALGIAIQRYRGIYAQRAGGEPARARAPLAQDMAARVADIKGAAYFMDASQVGICRIPPSAWRRGNADVPGKVGVSSNGGASSDAETSGDVGIVILVELPRFPERDNLASGWTDVCAAAVADLRAAEIAVVIAGQIRSMGWRAQAHLAGTGEVDLDKLAVLGGLAVRAGEELRNPYLGGRFRLAAVSTDYELDADLPLHADALNVMGWRYWWGINGAQSGRERNRQARRASHLSRYAMETVQRVDRPTTLILDDEVPRVSKRAAFFQRALHGDLGDKAKRERTRFAFKTPLSYSLLQLIRTLVPFQGGETATQKAAHFGDAAANARAIKSLAYFLGADLTGICEVPSYAWYSHREDGSEIQPYHRYAVVMLIDQGYDTMEGASGDDWISGAQSMRGYLRGAEIAGIMAEFLRAGGYAARSQTNADSDVLHIPLELWAGLGELSRIGELVLNPFVGPRFKSVVLTTDLPLEVDRPIDFGLQYFCSHCLKCARECPCQAISFEQKVMFNGYEMWKPDVERCARYRVTNPKGSACGRCMKTCPINKVVDADGGWITRGAHWLGVNAQWLKPALLPLVTWLDDALGNGRRNLTKKWWLDLEIVDGVAVHPKGTNQREIDPARRADASAKTIAYYPANRMPPPDEQGAVLVDRKAAIADAALLETPAAARERVVSGGAKPAHYVATPAANATGTTQEASSGTTAGTTTGTATGPYR